MFETLEMAPPDAILGLAEAFRNDSNPDKINLSVGEYRDADGKPYLLKCVQEAGRRIVASETTKGYLSIDGMPAYGEHVRKLMLGADHEIHSANRAVTVQTPGGTGALRVAADLVHREFPAAKIWCSSPTWANHPNVFQAAGLPVETYPYFDKASNGLDFDAMLSAIREIPSGDVLLLHACCHNPTGVDPSAAQWQQIADVVKERGILPLVDFAYQGFGDGIDEDSAGLRILADAVPECIICNSFSKNFGLYGERVGGMTMVAATNEAAQATLSHAKACVRSNYSNPPKHGAAIVETILQDADLTAQWQVELAGMRERINGTRQSFVTTLKSVGVDRDFSFITQQRGMFSFSGLSPVQVDELRSRFSIYIVGSGRINVAGITPHNVERLCEAIKTVL